MAISHARFKALRIAESWRGAISEDLQVTRAVQAAGGTVCAPRELLMRTPIITDGFAHIIEQARRWYMLVRVHAPVAYAIARMSSGAARCCTNSDADGAKCSRKFSSGLERSSG